MCTIGRGYVLVEEVQQQLLLPVEPMPRSWEVR
jgi:hypothetical protein